MATLNPPLKDINPSGMAALIDNGATDIVMRNTDFVVAGSYLHMPCEIKIGNKSAKLQPSHSYEFLFELSGISGPRRYCLARGYASSDVLCNVLPEQIFELSGCEISAKGGTRTITFNSRQLHCVELSVCVRWNNHS